MPNKEQVVSSVMVVDSLSFDQDDVYLRSSGRVMLSPEDNASRYITDCVIYANRRDIPANQYAFLRMLKKGEQIEVLIKYFEDGEALKSYRIVALHEVTKV